MTETTAPAKEPSFARWIGLIFVGIMVIVGAYSAWTVPINQSAVEHHDANQILSLKAYESGADFYLFNRCNMFITVDGKKFTFAGDEQNDECTFANPADAFRIMAYVRSSNDQ